MQAFFKNDSDGNRTRVTAVKGRCLNRLTTEPIGVVFAAELGNKCILSQVAMECKCFFEKIQKNLYSSNFGEQSGRKESGAGGMGVRRAAAKLWKI